MAIEKVISNTLQHYIDEANTSFGKAKEYVVLAYEQALREGYTPVEAKQLLLEKITVFSDRTIYRYLPDEAKDQKFQEIGKRNRSLTTVNGADEAFQREITREEKEEVLTKLWIIKQHINRTSLVNEWLRISFGIRCEPILERLYSDEIERPPADDIPCSQLTEKRHKNYYKVVADCINTFCQEITMRSRDGILVASTYNDGSLYCWLCAADDAYSNEIDHSNYIGREIVLPADKTHTNQYQPEIYSDEELAAHLLFYHLYDKQPWKKYEPYLRRDEAMK
jgi:hypothetical protein